MSDTPLLDAAADLGSLTHEPAMETGQPVSSEKLLTALALRLTLAGKSQKEVQGAVYRALRLAGVVPVLENKRKARTRDAVRKDRTDFAKTLAAKARRAAFNLTHD